MEPIREVDCMEQFLPLTRTERQLLRELRYITRVAYIEIKEFMDWETGIVGERRKISYQWLRETLYLDASQGKIGHSITKSQARHIIHELEKATLLTRLSKNDEKSLVFKLDFSLSDESVQNKFVRGAYEAYAKFTQKCAPQNPPFSPQNTTNSAECFEKYEREIFVSEIEDIEKCSTPLESRIISRISRNKYTLNLIQEIFSFWQTTLNHPGAKLDAKRKRVIENALKLGYSIDACKQAIRGCAHSAFHMGKNQEGKVYDHLSLILRDSERIEQFIALEKQSSTGQGEQRHANHHRTFVKTETPHQRVTRELGDQIREYEQKSGRSIWPPR